MLEVTDVHDLDGTLLSIDQAAAYLALKEAGFFDEKREWKSYESAQVGNPVDCTFNDYFDPRCEYYWGEEICEEYYRLYNGDKGEPFTEELVKNMDANTPLTFFPDWRTWERDNNDYVKIANYYGLYINIRVTR